MRRHPMQTACNPNCRGAPLTAEQRAVIRDFVTVLKSRHIAIEPVFVQITGRTEDKFWKLQNRNDYSAASLEWYTKVFSKFIEDFREGWYKVVYRKRLGYVERQQFPMSRVCPRGANLCKGGFNPGDCPRKWRECSLSRMLPPRAPLNIVRTQRVLREMGLLEP